MTSRAWKKMAGKCSKGVSHFDPKVRCSKLSLNLSWRKNSVDWNQLMNQIPHIIGLFSVKKKKYNYSKFSWNWLLVIKSTVWYRETQKVLIIENMPRWKKNGENMFTMPHTHNSWNSVKVYLQRKWAKGMKNHHFFV